MMIYKNKGFEFERDYYNNFEEKYQGDLEKQIGKITLESIYHNIKYRPTKKCSGAELVLGKYYTEGEEIADIILFSNTCHNLSLKYGKTVTFCNLGVSKLFKKEEFEKYTNNGFFKFNYLADKYLKLFELNINEFAETFINYGKNKKGNTYDVTNFINKDKLIDFTKRIIGYNYTLVHKLNDKINYIDLTTLKKLDEFVGKNIHNVTIQYGGVKGYAKRVNIIVKYDNMTITFNFRNKDGGVYPTHLMANFNINYEYIKNKN